MQYCKERGINATTFSGWLRSARAAATITLMPNAAVPRDENNEIEQRVPDAVKREGVRADAPLTALAVRIEAAASIVTANTRTSSDLREGLASLAFRLKLPKKMLRYPIFRQSAFGLSLLEGSAR